MKKPGEAAFSTQATPFYRDSDGYYWFHGRFDDIIKSGGYRIGPYEIEEVLMKHPAVLECSVIGVPDKLRGQAIKAIIVLAPGYEPSRALDREIRDFCNSQLAEYKWLRLIEFVDAMDKTISGKIKKGRAAQSGSCTRLSVENKEKGSAECNTA